jgi:hypothetical protein
MQDVLFQTLLESYVTEGQQITTNQQAEITLHLLAQMVPASYLESTVAPSLRSSEEPKTQAILRFTANLIKTYWEMGKGKEVGKYLESLVEPLCDVSDLTPVYKQRQRGRPQVLRLCPRRALHCRRPQAVRAPQPPVGALLAAPRRDLFKAQARQNARRLGALRINN